MKDLLVSTTPESFNYSSYKQRGNVLKSVCSCQLHACSNWPKNKNKFHIQKTSNRKSIQEKSSAVDIGKQGSEKIEYFTEI